MLLSDTKKIKFLYIVSDNALVGKDELPQRALMIINKTKGKIIEIIRENQNKMLFNETIERHKNEQGFHDFKSLFVMPGIIDGYVHLNTDGHDQWSFVQTSTAMAAAYGITTMVDHPMMSTCPENSDECAHISRRIKVLQQSHLNIDVGLMALLQNYTLNYMKEIIKTGVLGFTAYLMPPFQPKLTWLDVYNFQESLKNVHSLKTRLTIAVYCEACSGRELVLASPYRDDPLEARLSHEDKFESNLLKDSYADGDIEGEMKLHSSEFSNDDSLNDSLRGNLSEKLEKNSPMTKRSSPTLHVPKKNIRQYSSILVERDKKIHFRGKKDYPPEMTPNSRHLKILSFKNSNKSTMRDLSHIEILSYKSFESIAGSDSSQDTESPFIPLNESIEEEFKVPNLKVSSPISSQVHHSNRSYSSQLELGKKKRTFKKEEGQGKLSLLEIKPPGKIEKDNQDFNFIWSKMRRNQQKSSLNSKLKTQSLEKKKNKAMKEKKKGKEDKLLSKKKPPFTIFPMKFTKDIIPIPKFNPVVKKSSLLQRRKKFMKGVKLTLKTKPEPFELENFRYKYSIFTANRPIIWQKKAFICLMKALKSTPNPLFKVILLNVSSASLISSIREYNKKKKSRRIEVAVLTPHLTLHSGRIKDGMPKYKSGQPIRDKGNRKLLLYHHKIKSISCVCSGHMFVPDDFKNICRGCLIKSFNGFCSVGFNIHSLWTSLVLMKVKHFIKEAKRIISFNEGEIRSFFRNFDLEVLKMARVFSRKPAEVFHLPEKGILDEGRDADFFIWDPFKSTKNNIDVNFKKNHIFNDIQFLGSVEMTFLRGRCIFSRKNRDILVEEGIGSVLFRTS